ncbi:MAG: AMP-binding protein, partial [Chloroflexota bacterium]
MKAADLPIDYNAVHILEHNLKGRADKIGLHSNERSLTFQEVSDEVNQVANALTDLGVNRGDYVGLLCLDLPEWVTVFFATLKCAGIHVGLNTLLTAPEYDYMLNDSKMKVLIVHETLVPSIEPVLAKQKYLTEIIVIGTAPTGMTSYLDWIKKQPTTFDAVATHREDIATLNYSSGTTGEPKGILHAHKDLALPAEHWGKNVLGLTEDDRTFSGAKLFFTFGTGGNLLFP